MEKVSLLKSLGALQALQDNIHVWSDKQFDNGQNRPSRSISISHHLQKESKELTEALEKFINKVEALKDDIIDDELLEFESEELVDLRKNCIKEAADCFMLLLDSMAHINCSVWTLACATEIKLEENKKRKWGKPDENGVVEHIRE